MACVAFTTQPQLFPVVQFTNGYVQTMGYHIWPSETIPGVGVAQIPLILAWALTIHKSQGATLDIAEIDAGSGIFECGQTYVALSRVKSLEGLYLSSFNATRVKINKKVQDFYEKLENEQLAQQSESLIQSREIERLPEAYVETSETTNIPVAVAVPITAVPTTDNSVEIYPL
jgi:hypothetical protein